MSNLNFFQSKKFWARAKNIQNDVEFNSLSIELFQYQAEHVVVYRDFLNYLKTDISSITHFSEIPFLPVSFFKNHVISDQKAIPNFYFSSSGTTGQATSRHYVPDSTIYDESLLHGFEIAYGHPSQYVILALLPSYLEREGSSLIYMVEKLIAESGNTEGGFFLHNHEALHEKIKNLEASGKKIFLIGVTYALLDFFEKYPMQLSHTRGMKGRRKELIKSELHEQLKLMSGVETVHSEYGMTELLTQAYSKGEGIFDTPSWMKILVRDLHDPFSNLKSGQTGTLNIIDLANIHSCAFLATDDLGRKHSGDFFEVLGRIDHSELRGCNLMVE